MINFPKWLEDQSDENLAEYLPYAEYMSDTCSVYEARIWLDRKAQVLAEQKRRAVLERHASKDKE